MNTQTTTNYGVNVYTLTAHIVKRWKNEADCTFVTMCGKASGGNSSIYRGELPNCFDLCPKCEAKSN